MKIIKTLQKHHMLFGIIITILLHIACDLGSFLIYFLVAPFTGQWHQIAVQVCRLPVLYLGMRMLQKQSGQTQVRFKKRTFALIAIFFLFVLAVPPQSLYKTFATATVSRDPTVYALDALLTAPIVEEILFRGILLPVSMKYMPFYPAMILNLILFISIHDNPFAVMGILAVVAGSAILYRVTGRIRYGVCLHMVFNWTPVLTAMLPIPFMIALPAYIISVVIMIVIFIKHDWVEAKLAALTQPIPVKTKKAKSCNA